MWTIKSKKGGSNLIVGKDAYKTLAEAKNVAAKWAIVQFLRTIDPKLFKGYSEHGNNTFYRIEYV